VSGLSTHLKREAGERETQTQGEQRRYEDGEKNVAASSRESEAVAAEPPGAFGTPDPFRLADHVIPHHLRNDCVHARVKSISIAPLNLTRYVRANDCPVHKRGYYFVAGKKL